MISGIRSGPTALVTNDDGINSEGLAVLARVALDAGLDVIVAAPDDEASGTSAAMTATATDGRVRLTRSGLAGRPGVSGYAVAALPAFIVFTGLHGAYGPVPEVVLSGINRGPNTGRAILHSGTVGAAMTAAVRGVRAAAFSLDLRPGDGPEHWGTAAHVAGLVLPAVARLDHGVVLNVNVPNIPLAELKGLRTGTLAGSAAFEVSVAGTAENYLEVRMTENGSGHPPGSDSALLAAGYASVSAFLPVTEAARFRLDGLLAPGLG